MFKVPFPEPRAGEAGRTWVLASSSLGAAFLRGVCRAAAEMLFRVDPTRTSPSWARRGVRAGPGLLEPQPWLSSTLCY